MSNGKDVFAGIAAGGISGRKENLLETSPIEIPEVYFNSTAQGCRNDKELSYEEKLKEFNEGIKKLRKRYEPFLKNLNLATESIRKRQYIEEFNFKFQDENEAKKVTIPHYTGPAGRWKATYTSQFDMDLQTEGKRIFIVFKGVDYKAAVYVNNKYIGSHEGFFASFEFDVTDFLERKNILEVWVENDIPTIGNGDMQVNGDKLYAATGLGWDDPKDGWHHCPAGGGIFDRVYIETRSPSYIEDVFIRPDIDISAAKIMVSYYSFEEENSEVEFNLEILSYNFTGRKKQISVTRPAGHGLNYYYIDTDIEDYRIWEPDSPYLYLCRISTECDSIERTFGMRKFHMDTDCEPKGDLYFNNKPILLRGANEMGHLQLSVMRNDYDQLIDDILIAKYCNMNYYRLTQRPVQEEIYHYCDMLGMLCQTDLPLFGYMRKNQFFEGVRQAGEMERHVRNHPSVIMSTYINEPFAPDKYGLEHRHLDRRELELFFDACDTATYLENPDRVIKRVEGDYDPPTEKGLSDFHCYNMWYTNHALPIGMLYKGFLPALNKGWKTGCGEYGTEGLDNYEIMRKYYPSEWLPGEDDENWIPDRIIKSQTNTMHGDWYEDQDNIHDWIETSQEHQAFATKIMTLAFRRRSDMIVSTAIHLLIDAWPSGWMKTLLDADRVPKKAYFDFKDSLEPFKVNLRCDRWSAYEDEEINVEAWILNDTDERVEDIELRASLRIGDRTIESYVLGNIESDACTSIPAGILECRMPQTKERSTVYVDVCMMHGGEQISVDTFDIEVHPAPETKFKILSLGEDAKILVENSPVLFGSPVGEADAIIVSSPDEYIRNIKGLPTKKPIIFMVPEGQEKSYSIKGKKIRYKPVFDSAEIGEDGALKGLSFVAMSDSIKRYFQKNDFSYWYNSDKGFIDHVAEYYIDINADELLAFGFEKPSFGKGTKGKKTRLPVACIYDDSFFISFETRGRAGCNPALDKLIGILIQYWGY